VHLQGTTYKVFLNGGSVILGKYRVMGVKTLASSVIIWNSLLGVSLCTRLPQVTVFLRLA
jgi:hypothetical protein